MGEGERRAEVARAALERMAREGVPNYFGLQRFGGEGGRTHLLGFALFRDDAQGFLDLLLDRGPGGLPKSWAVERQAARMRDEGRPAGEIVRAIPEKMRFLYLSAAQSAIFNALLDERLEAGALARLEAGDIAWIHRNGACFLVEDPAAEQTRADRFELSPAGPLPGARTLRAAGEVAAREEAALRRFGLAPDAFDRAGGGRLVRPPEGARRPYRVPLSEAEVAPRSDGSLRVAFFLPAGSYATAVISELLRREVG